jgi:Tfp pilus assembly protein PilO
VTVDRSRIWTIGAVVVICAVLALGWLLGVAPELAQAHAAESTRAGVETLNAADEKGIDALKKQFDDLTTLEGTAATLRLAVPTEADAPAIIAEFNQVASTSAVTITSVALSDALPYEPPAAATTSGSGTAVSGTSATATPTPTATSTPVASGTGISGTGTLAAGTASGLTSDNFVTVPITVTVEGTYARVLDFVGGLQSGSRLMLVTGFSTAPSDVAATAATGVVTANISVYVFVLLDGSAPVTGGTTP